MTKALTLEELNTVTGGWTISAWRQFLLTCGTIEGIYRNLTLQQIQDAICETDEERRFVKKVYEYYHG